MGLMKQLRRSISDLLADFTGLFRKKKRRSRAEEPIKIHRTWLKPGGAASAKQKKHEVKIIKQQKIRIPGLRKINRILAGIFLFINFVFSQFLLGSIGAAAQPVFILFLGNCYFIIKYLWLSRKEKD